MSVIQYIQINYIVRYFSPRQYQNISTVFRIQYITSVRWYEHTFIIITLVTRINTYILQPFWIMYCPCLLNAVISDWNSMLVARLVARLVEQYYLTLYWSMTTINHSTSISWQDMSIGTSESSQSLSPIWWSTLAKLASVSHITSDWSFWHGVRDVIWFGCLDLMCRSRSRLRTRNFSTVLTSVWRFALRV